MSWGTQGTPSQHGESERLDTAGISELRPEDDLDKNEKEQSAIDQRLEQFQMPACVSCKSSILL